MVLIGKEKIKIILIFFMFGGGRREREREFNRKVYILVTRKFKLNFYLDKREPERGRDQTGKTVNGLRN